MHTDGERSQVEVTDAPLTEVGRQQAKALALKTAVLEPSLQPEVIIVSPLSRSILTTLLAFRHFVSVDGKTSLVPCIALESVRETFGVHLCDRRRDTSELALDFPAVDFSGLAHADPFDHEERESLNEGVQRCKEFLEWLHAREETVVAVGTHSSWLLRLFNGALDCGSDDKICSKFEVGELRSVVLEWEEEGP